MRRRILSLTSALIVCMIGDFDTRAQAEWNAPATLLSAAAIQPQDAVGAGDQDLAGYFGFEALESVKIGRYAGPVTCADIDADGLLDLVVVNNHESRIEVHYQRTDASPESVIRAPRRVNEFPEHWRFRREFVSVTHRVTAIVPHDYDGDGLTDLIYSGIPAEIVFVRQTTPGLFEVQRRHRIRNLSANRDGLAVANVVGDDSVELIALVDGAIQIRTIDDESLGAPLELGAGGKIIAIIVEDFDGDGRLDLAGAIPDDPAPLRVWFGDREKGLGVIGAQIRFEMAPLVEFAAVRLPGVAAARLAVIERASKRLVLYEIATEQIEETGDRDAAIRIHGFTDAGNRDRDHAVVDLDGDGLLDLVATDTEANALVVYRQRAEKGLQPGESHPSLSEITSIAAGNVDDDDAAELYVLSEKEGVVGRCDVTPDGIPFPLPLPISAGHSPVVLNLLSLGHGEHAAQVAVVAKDGREYVVDLIHMDGEIETIELGKLSRSPEAIVSLDADQDGRTDLLLFTRDKPMTMLHAGDDGFELKESKDMGQFGLVQAARTENIAVVDIDGDGKDELLIADKNFVRAVRYDPSPPAGVSQGWHVIAQINARDSSSKLVSLASLGDRIVAADKENDRLVVMARDPDSDGSWQEVESLTVRGFSFTDIHAGAFSGDGEENIIAIGDDGFAVIRLSGARVALRETGSWRSEDERRVHHELGIGDVNGDGFTDMICLDAGEQMCEIFTFSESGHMLHATGFQVFESQIFSGGEAREFEPSQIIVADITGDGANDLVLLAHDRVLIYPQMVEAD